MIPYCTHAITSNTTKLIILNLSIDHRKCVIVASILLELNILVVNSPLYSKREKCGPNIIINALNALKDDSWAESI